MERSSARSLSEGERLGDTDRNREPVPEWETGQSHEEAGWEGQAEEVNATEKDSESVEERRAEQVNQSEGPVPSKTFERSNIHR